MNKEITVYHNCWVGYGCVKTQLKITDDNFLSETDTIITVKETYPNIWGGESEDNMGYHKTLAGFIQSEKDRYKKDISQITERHRDTLEMANDLLSMEK